MTTFPSMTGAVLLAAWLGARDAQAQEVPSAPAVPGPVADLSEPEVEGEQRKPIPALVIAFEDPPATDGLLGDCDPELARHGRCIEYVGLVDAPWGDGDARVGALSTLYAQLNEELALRWARSETPLGRAFSDAGFTDYGLPPEHWERAGLNKHSAAMPSESFWLKEQDVHASTGLFRSVDFHMPKSLQGEVPEPKQLSLMTGRFALRLGRDGKPFEHDIMDGDSRSSAPFFEQMFPYSVDPEVLARKRFAAPIQPLQAFQLPERLLEGEEEVLASVAPHSRPVIFGADAGVGSVMDEAHKQFEIFARFLSVTVASYAMRDHTLNQMRIFTALTAMMRHPGMEGSTGKANRRLVAAARGETDSDKDILEAIQVDALALVGGARLRIDALPKEVLSSWLARIQEEYPPSQEVIDAFGAEVLRNHRAVVRVDAQPPDDMAEAAIEAWVSRSLQSGAAREKVALGIKITALQQLLDSLSTAARERVETWILLDHVQEELYLRMTRLGADRVSPEDVSTMGRTAWQVVLEEHGHISHMVQQGRRAVDPTAICTTRPGLDAMSEPAFGETKLDLLVLVEEAEDGGLATWESVLEAARKQSPFFLVDDPLEADPEISRLVDVPGSQALYRIRWNIWTGWHLLWGLQELPSGRERLVPWTTAICDDTVLAPSHLVDTLVRGGLLEGRLFPTEPVRMADVRAEERAEARAARQARKGTAAEREAAADDKADKAVAGADGMRGRLQALQEGGVGSLRGATDTRAAEGVANRADDVGEVVQQADSAAARYLQYLARGGLVHDDHAEDGVLVYAFNFDRAIDEYPPMVRPTTPYAVHELWDEDGSRLRAAAWAMVLEPSRPPEVGANPPIDHTLVAPAYRATDSVAVEEQQRPIWKRAHPIDWTLSASLGGFPFRQVNSSCNVPGDDLDVLAPCPDEDELPIVHRSNGLSSDISALMTFWWLDSPRLAFEWGLESHLDVVVPGSTRFFAYDPTVSRADTIDYGLMFRPAAGVLAGIRHAPSPMPLYRKRQDGTLWGIQGGDTNPRLMRTQWGIRSGVLFGPGYSGLEATAVGEWWWGWALRRRQGSRAHLTPYHPAVLVGPYVRGQYAVPVPGFEMLDDGQPRALALDNSMTVLLGARVHVRVNQKATPPVIQ